MRLRKPSWLARAEAGLRPLDHVPRRIALAAGGAVGAGAGALAGWTGEPWALGVGAGVLGLAAWLAGSGEPIAVEERKKKLSDALGMIELPGGTFWMGSEEGEPGSYDGEQPRHRETIEPFAMSRYVVRQSLYHAVMGENPSSVKGDDLPVTDVSWFDAVRFCNALSERERRRRAYRIGEGEQPTVEWDPTADGFRLPTEAEWEYAARAGTTTAYSFGDDASQLDEYAWWHSNSNMRPHPVGMKKPNPWGLFDVHGNVYEWCWDVFGTYDKPRSTVGARVLRGGSFGHSYPRTLHSAFRSRNLPEGRFDYFGFRCARGLSLQH
ncbi:MAG: formylglycine-generating enzyme family protein [Polyangiaceae bacterium]|nr:formylglycine-generating enzyme family protein [Polyangiaceae bacterium]